MVEAELNQNVRNDGGSRWHPSPGVPMVEVRCDMDKSQASRSQSRLRSRSGPAPHKRCFGAGRPRGNVAIAPTRSGSPTRSPATGPVAPRESTGDHRSTWGGAGRTPRSATPPHRPAAPDGAHPGTAGWDTRRMMRDGSHRKRRENAPGQIEISSPLKLLLDLAIIKWPNVNILGYRTWRPVVYRPPCNGVHLRAAPHFRIDAQAVR